MIKIDLQSKRKQLEDIINKSKIVYIVSEEEVEIINGEPLTSFLGGATLYLSDFEIEETESNISLKIKEKTIKMNKAGVCKNLVFWDSINKRAKIILDVYEENLLQGIEYNTSEIIYTL